MHTHIHVHHIHINAFSYEHMVDFTVITYTDVFFEMGFLTFKNNNIENYFYFLCKSNRILSTVSLCITNLDI